jgi:ribose transport system ATP-binding protein
MTPLLTARGLHKRFIGVQALQEVSAEFFPGEVVAVMGENGAGKSTLMKCLAGVHEPDAGVIEWEGRPVRVDSTRRSESLGIAFIHQELNLCDNLSIAENVFLGREPRRARIFVDRSTMQRRTSELLARVGLNISPDARVDRLSIGRRQLVEIARALSQQARLVIMDEPTSSLTKAETDTLFGVVRELKAAGVCVVFISHRIPEVMTIADRVTVLKDGKNSGSLTRAEMTPERIVSLMVGRDLDLKHRRPPQGQSGAVLLSAKDLRTAVWPQHGISFDLRAGEITGMAGLVGAGRSEIARALFGIDRPLSGTVNINGHALIPGNPRAAIAAGVAFAPEDRKEQGVILEMAISENIALPGLNRMARAGFINDGEVNAQAERMKQQLSIRTPDVHKAVGQLSGGNQQKVVLAKWLALNPSVFLLDEPTRGVDVGSKREIYEVIESLAAAGSAVLVISSDLEEILRLSDRVLVMHEGRLAGELPNASLSEESIMTLATGRAAA